MEQMGLRERKKARTRSLIADSAARLFAERGYEQVAVVDVAREADVSEQTVYNYFPTKEHLVVDREAFVANQLSELIRSRPPSVSPAAAVREFVLDFVDEISRMPEEEWRGELGHLSAISPSVYRLVLEMTDRRGSAIAADISASTPVKPEIARIQGMALANVFQLIIVESGQRTQNGQSQARISAELRPIVKNILGELDRWFRS